MSLVIEDGSNVADATSYVTRAEIIAYAAARGVTIADAAGTDVLAIKAMDYIERQNFKGIPGYGVPGVVQSVQFPRSGIMYEGDFLSSTAIPKLLKLAQCEAAMLLSQGIDIEPNRPTTAQSVKSEKVGPLETEYFAPEWLKAITPNLDAYLKPLVHVGFGINVIRA